MEDASLFLVYVWGENIKHQEVTDIACTCGLFGTPDPCGRRYQWTSLLCTSPAVQPHTANTHCSTEGSEGPRWTQAGTTQSSRPEPQLCHLLILWLQVKLPLFWMSWFLFSSCKLGMTFAFKVALKIEWDYDFFFNAGNFTSMRTSISTTQYISKSSL